MAAKGQNVAVCIQKALCFGHPLQISALTCRPLICHQQTRWRKGFQTTKNMPKPWHVPRRAPFIKDDLTAENKALLREVIEDQYTQAKPNVLKEEPWARNEWQPWTVRTGVLGIKIGVQPQWKKDGTKIQCQLIQILDNHVIRYIPPEEFQNSLGWSPKFRPGTGCVMVGSMGCDPRQFTKAYANLFLEAGVPPKRRITRFLVSPDAAIQPGTPLNVMHFKVGDYVDCSAKTINQGFQGVMNKWGFAGGPASHGSTKFHRRPGTLSSGRHAKGLWKGTKMPGHMGNIWRIKKGLKIWRINTKYNILYVTEGSPGPNHGYVRVYDTLLPRHRHSWETQPDKHMPMPTFFPGDIDGEIPEDIYDDELFQFDQPSITFQDVEEVGKKKK